MGIWTWDGLDKNGKRARGQLEAKSERDARKLLRAQGIRAKTLRPPSMLEFDISEWLIDKGIASPFSNKDLMHFTKQLAIMIGSGVPIMQALEILFKSTRQPVLKRAIKKIANDVGEGLTIAEAMKKQKGFDKLYCNLVRAGEAGGVLDSILMKLATHIEKQEKTKAQIKSAMTYPTIVSLVGIVVIWGMMVFVVPQFLDLLESSNQEVPWVTQAVVDISKWLSEYILVCIAGFIAFVIFILAYIKTASGKELYDYILMKMPIFGSVVIKGNLSSFTRTLATMLTSGVALVDSLEICIETIDNTIIARDIKKVRQKVIAGKTIADPLMKIKYFPDMVGQMIKVGEQTGALDEMLVRVSDVFEEEVNEMVGNMTKMLEPIIIVVLGGIVAFILLAMYLPIFKAAG